MDAPTLNGTHPRKPGAETAPPKLVESIARGPDCELRFYVLEVEHHPYIKVEKWERDRRGWYRSGPGITVRPREVVKFIDALNACVPLLDRQGNDPKRNV